MPDEHNKTATNISLSRKMAYNGGEIANLVCAPFKETAEKLQWAALVKAGNHFVRHDRRILTLKTLPSDIYDALPKGEHLLFSKGAIPLDEKLPELNDFIGDKWSRGKLSSEEIFEGQPEREEEWRAALPIKERGSVLYHGLMSYFERARYTTIDQLVWSAPELVSTILHLHEPPKRYYSRQRLYREQDNFVDKLSKRRYVDPAEKRKPRKILPFPPDLLPYLGEAKLLHTALKDKGK